MHFLNIPSLFVWFWSFGAVAVVQILVPRKDYKANKEVLATHLRLATEHGTNQLMVVDPMSTSWPNCIGSHQERSYHCRPDVHMMA
eukprot:16378-Amphidinium_carterae.2